MIDSITVDDLVNWYCEEQGIEIWKDIPGYEGVYQVSNMGRVKSMERYINAPQSGGSRKIPTKVLKPTIGNHGYYVVNIGRKAKTVHSLIAKTFCPNPNGYQMVNHIDENKLNNNAANLEWCDCKYNINFGTGKVRSARSRCKQVSQYNTDGKLIKIYESVTEAAKSVGLRKTSISAVARHRPRCKTAAGYVWRYVT